MAPGHALLKTFGWCCRKLGCSCLTLLPSCSIIFPVVPHPNPQEDDAKFSEFSKRAEDGPSRAGRLSKTIPEVPTVFRVSSGNPESRLGILWDSEYSRVGWDRGALQGCLLIQVRTSPSRLTRNSPYSANLEFESRADSQK